MFGRPANQHAPAEASSSQHATDTSRQPTTNGSSNPAHDQLTRQPETTEQRENPSSDNDEWQFPLRRTARSPLNPHDPQDTAHSNNPFDSLVNKDGVDGDDASDMVLSDLDEDNEQAHEQDDDLLKEDEPMDIADHPPKDER
ncbi:hypothetical protein DFQ26_001907, partial [Actinomortierella ambigua]